MPTRNINNDLKVNANLYLNMDTNSLSGDSNGAVVLAGYDSLTLKTQSSPRLTINSSGNATFAGDINLGTGKNIYMSGNSGLRLVHDGSNGNVISGTGDLNITNGASDKDIKFKGNDGGSNFTALTLDMSAGGNATFASNAIFGGYVNTTLVFGTTDLNLGYAGGTSGIFIKGSTALAGNVGIGSTAPSVGLQLGNSVSGQTKTAIFNSEGGSEVGLTIQSRTNRAKLRVADNDSNAYVVAEAGKAFFGTSSNGDANNITVLTGGNVGIGTVSPYSKLHVVGDTPIIQIRETSGAAEAGISINHAVSGNHVNFFIGTLDGNARKLTIGGTITDGHSTNTAQAAASLMLIDEQTGNVGIGTTNPSDNLTVEGGGITLGGTGRIQGIDTVSASTDAANKAYVDAQVGASDTLQEVTDNGNTTTNTIRIESTDFASLVLDRGASNASIVQFENDNGIVGGIGGYNDDGLIFRSKDGNQMALNASNNFGIGTINPLGKLHVRSANAGSFTYDTNADDVIVESNANGGITIATAAANTSRVIFASPDDATGGEISFNQTAKLMKIGPTTANGLLGLQSANGVETMRLDASNRVGIGTTSPTEKLEVAGNVKLTGNLNVGGYIHPNDENGNLRIFGGNDTTNDAQILLHGNSDSWGSLEFNYGYDSTNSFLKISQGSNEHLRITNGGKVGIGATDPLRKLHVVGDFAVNAGTGEYYGVLINGGESADPKITIGDWHNSSGTIHWDSSSNYLRIDSQHSTANAPIAFTGNDGATEYMRIDNAGNVGIGTNNPSYPLEVAGAGTVSIAYQRTGVTGPKKWGFHSDSSNTYWQNLTDNVLALTVSNAGNIGIGTTGPAHKLHIASGTTNVGIQTISTDAGAYMGFEDNTTGNTGSNSNVLIGANGNNLVAFTNATERLRIDSSGNVGIGTTNPSEKLEVVGDIKASSSGNTQVILTSGGGCVMDLLNAQSEAYVRTTSAHDLHFRTTDTNRMVIKAGGNVGIGTTNPHQKFDVSGGNINIQNGDGSFLTFNNGDANLTIHYDGNTGRDLSFKTWNITEGNIERMRIDKDGNVGIGTASPSAKLDVSGNIYPTTDNTYTLGEAQTKEWSSVATRMVTGNNNRMVLELSGDVVILRDHNSVGDGVQIKNQGSVVAQFGDSAGSGNVGIGTTAPDFKLEIVADDTGGVMAVRNAANARDTFRSENAAGTRTFNIGNDANGHGLVLVRGAGGTTTSQIAGNGDTYFDTDTLYIDHSTNRVGIGTTNPSQKLHVEGNIELQAGWEIGSNNGSYWQRIRTEDSSVSTTNAFNFETRNGSGSFIKHVVIRNDGNVGVGNATPATKLAVEGTIAHKVYTVATLPSASPAGQRAFVSDSSYSVSDAHGLVTVGSGSNFCPMYSDGTNWRVG